MNQPAMIPTRANMDAAWERYRTLAIRWAEDHDARLDFTFNVALATAWRDWRDLALALDLSC